MLELKLNLLMLLSLVLRIWRNLFCVFEETLFYRTKIYALSIDKNVSYLI